LPESVSADIIFLCNILGRIKKGNTAFWVVGFDIFLLGQSGSLFLAPAFGKIVFRLVKNFAEFWFEFFSDRSGKFNMLFLIFAEQAQLALYTKEYRPPLK